MQAPSQQPLFTIVTACFNAAGFIRNCLASVSRQDIDPHLIEHVFVDGGSHDDTLAIIRANAIGSHRIHSGKDKGIYDAMNKGIAMAQGRWLLFLNADDQFAKTTVLSQVAAHLQKHPQAEFAYGKAANLQDGKLLNFRGSPISPAQYWFPVDCMCHQAIFFRKDIFDRHGLFELGIAGGIADYVWLVKYFHTPHGEVLFMDELICNFAEGGYSLTHVWDGYLAHLKFAKEFFPWNIRLRFYAMYPKKFLKFKILRLHEDTAFRRFYRMAMRKLVHERKLTSTP